MEVLHFKLIPKFNSMDDKKVHYTILMHDFTLFDHESKKGFTLKRLTVKPR